MLRNDNVTKIISAALKTVIRSMKCISYNLTKQEPDGEKYLLHTKGFM